MAIPIKLSPKEEEAILRKRWKSKRASTYNLAGNMSRLKYAVHKDLYEPKDEKDQLTALVVRILIRTSERIGNESSGLDGHFGITEFRHKHIDFVAPNKVLLHYVGKSGIMHDKSFSDDKSYVLLKKLFWRDHIHIFTTYDGFRIRPDRVNRYLSRFGMKSKDVRGFNSNRMMLEKLAGVNIKEEKERKHVFNDALRNVAARIGHLPTTLRKHYLLPEIEEEFYRTGKIKKIKID